MKPAVRAYLARLDAHLAAVAAPRERIRLIDDERWRVDRLERALCRTGPPAARATASRQPASPPSTSPCCTASFQCGSKPRAKPPSSLSP